MSSSRPIHGPSQSHRRRSHRASIASTRTGQRLVIPSRPCRDHQYSLHIGQTRRVRGLASNAIGLGQSPHLATGAVRGRATTGPPAALPHALRRRATAAAGTAELLQCRQQRRVAPRRLRRPSALPGRPGFGQTKLERSDGSGCPRLYSMTISNELRPASSSDGACRAPPYISAEPGYILPPRRRGASASRRLPKLRTRRDRLSPAT